LGAQGDAGAAELARPVALSDRAARGLARIRAARSEYTQIHGVEPTNAELRGATGFTQVQLDSLQVIERAPRGMEERLSTDDDTTSTVGDLVIDPLAEEEYQQVLDEIEVQDVRELADQLDERERAVILAHYGLGRSAQTLGEIGGALGLTAERAQIEIGALNKLRGALAHPALSPAVPI
jgi:DNA-directed RNA polymerase sigma subunit (sigma70/sigma32)